MRQKEVMLDMLEESEDGSCSNHVRWVAVVSRRFGKHYRARITIYSMLSLIQHGTALRRVVSSLIAVVEQL